MTDWGARARAALAQKAQGATPITTETRLLGVLGVPTPTVSRNEPAFNDAESLADRVSAETDGVCPETPREINDLPALEALQAPADPAEPESGRDQQPPTTGAELARPYRLTPDQMARGHAYLWDEAAVDRFLARARVFRRRGMNAQDSEDLAERLQVRDGDCDDRRLCLECSKLRENGGCTAAMRGELIATDRRHQPTVNILYRCEAFSLREGLQ